MVASTYPSTSLPPAAGRTAAAPRQRLPEAVAVELLIGALAAGAAVVVGATLGIASHSESAIARLGAPWVLVAFGIGALVGALAHAVERPRLSWFVAPGAAALCLTVANSQYYFDAARPTEDLLDHHPYIAFWTVAGWAVGVVFGLAGAVWARRRSSTGAAVAVGILAVVLAGEPLVWLAAGSGRVSGPGGAATALALAATAVALPLVLLPRGRRAVATAVVAGALPASLTVLALTGAV